MIKPIVIKVTDKVPELVSGPEYVVCDNSDYTVVWQLDEEWAQLEHRTMQVNYKDGTYERVLFTGDACALPAIPVPGPVHVGLFAGDIHTTRPARLLAVRSATTDSGEERTPMPNGYAQAIEALDGKLDKNQGAENAGKALVVGDDGNVVPGEVQGGSYTLPVASPEQLGGVKPTAKTDEMTQQVGVDEDGALYTKPGKASDPVQPDWNQNDETAPDYVKNRPGGYDVQDVNITWDGDTTGKPVAASNKNYFVKVSDSTPSKSELLGGTAVYVSRERAEEDTETISLDESQMMEMDGCLILNEIVIIVYNSPVSIDGYSLTEAGVWFGGKELLDTSSSIAFCSSLQSTPTPVKIPQKYLDLDSKANKSIDITATLLASGWMGENAPYIYNLSVTGVTATSNQELLPALDITTAQLTALQAANIQDNDQYADTVSLKAFGTKPTIDLPIRIILRGD